MKKFKDILREFRENSDPPRDNRGGGDHENEVLNFMNNIPFNHKTADEHEFNFNNAKEAGLMIATGLDKQERAFNHAHIKNDEFMKLYFSKSARTHEDILDGLMNHVANHPKLPKHLRPHVPGAIEKLQNKGRDIVSGIEKWASTTGVTPMGHTNNMGEIIYNLHSKGIAPSHINSTLHHLREIEDDIENDPSGGIGYILRKGEV
jgi:hypothetical protein